MGEVGYAYIELSPGAQISTQELGEYCKAHIASFKVPRYFEFLSDWPKTGSQKIKKNVLKERAELNIAKNSGQFLMRARG